ncbi:MAG: plasmid mobilization relaxosome protein MobC [Helicobacteraceae bacterium]|nr:plasmid mobilization relaxosome protein MobC [Helicobacteraceae bacterium]
MRKLSKIITFKVSDREIEVLEQKIAGVDLSKSEFLRQSIFYNQVVPLDKDFRKKQLFLMSNLTNNVNQIARRCNTLKRVDREVLENLELIVKIGKEITGCQNGNS